jgi:hypothetical protein
MGIRYNIFMFKFQIISRMNTRSVSYSKKSVIAAIEACGLTWRQSDPDKMILHVEVPSLEQRKELERQLQLIDRNVAYRIITQPPKESV